MSYKVLVAIKEELEHVRMRYTNLYNSYSP